VKGPTSWRIREALIDAWEAGNCTGLDGWVGEGRGTQEPDQQAIYNRDRDVNKIVNGLYPDPETLPCGLCGGSHPHHHEPDYESGPVQ
jgi:hypothetical protein